MNDTTKKIRPYARLLTMLGNQLIKNEIVALTEIVKNSYDADANIVKVNWVGFDDDYNAIGSSKIIIEDDGIGMDLDIIEKHWLNPATPEKKIKKINKKNKTKEGRFIQGEKGIGRFALLKLGKVIDITTTHKGITHKIQYDFSMFDEDFLQDTDGSITPLFLDELEVQVIPHGKTGNKDGTKIEISNIEEKAWSVGKIDKFYKETLKFQDTLITLINNPDTKKDFSVHCLKDGTSCEVSDSKEGDLLTLIADRTILAIENGAYNQKEQHITFSSKPANSNSHNIKLTLDDERIRGVKWFKQHFGENENEWRDPTCGDFEFNFYIFDFAGKSLDKKDKDIIKEHRVYLYRDSIRVLPYGDPEDDWLQVDMIRGTSRASDFFSNDQMIGVVNISQENNPDLQDKTNREGLIETGTTYKDFIVLLQTILTYIKKELIKQQVEKEKNKNTAAIIKEGVVKKSLNEITEKINKEHPKLKKDITIISDAYNKEKAYLNKRVETTEQLAGVGLSVEAASHDVNSIISKLQRKINGLVQDIELKDCRDIDLSGELTQIKGLTGFISDQMSEIGQLFVSTKQRKKPLRLNEKINNVAKIYRRLMEDRKIKLVIEDQNSPLVAKTTDAVLLQLLLNLFDNAVYWLQFNEDERQIKITLNGRDGYMIFSDNGSGVHLEDEPYIFEPFFSGKGEDGRGLGLYIAKQILELQNYSIELISSPNSKVLGGANFKIYFINE